MDDIAEQHPSSVVAQEVLEYVEGASEFLGVLVAAEELLLLRLLPYFESLIASITRQSVHIIVVEILHQAEDVGVQDQTNDVGDAK